MAKEEYYDRTDEHVDVEVIPPPKKVQKDLEKAMTEWEKLVTENFLKLGE